MAYATYITEAIVVGSRDNYTSDRAYLLFTREAGMIWASARSVREERSKQRYALQDFSHIRVSLVKGKRAWRIGSVEGLSNLYAKANTRAARGAVTHMLRLLRQYVQGEEVHQKIFDLTVAAGSYMTRTDAVLSAVTDVYTLRLLHALGYVADDEVYEALLTAEGWEYEKDDVPPRAHAAITRAHNVSHL